MRQYLRCWAVVCTIHMSWPVEPASLIPSKEQKDKNFYLAFPNLEILQVKLKLLWIRKEIKHLEKLHNTTKTNPPVKLRKEVLNIATVWWKPLMQSDTAGVIPIYVLTSFTIEERMDFSNKRTHNFFRYKNK